MTETDHDARPMYLDQLRRDLTRYGMHERMPVRWPWRPRLLHNTNQHPYTHAHGYSPFGKRKRDLGLDRPAEAETMIGMKRLTSLQHCV